MAGPTAEQVPMTVLGYSIVPLGDVAEMTSAVSEWQRDFKVEAMPTGTPAEQWATAQAYSNFAAEQAVSAATGGYRPAGQAHERGRALREAMKAVEPESGVVILCLSGPEGSTLPEDLTATQFLRRSVRRARVRTGSNAAA